MKSAFYIYALLFSLAASVSGQNVIVDLVNGNAARPAESSVSQVPAASSSLPAQAASSSAPAILASSSSAAASPTPESAQIPESVPALPNTIVISQSTLNLSDPKTPTSNNSTIVLGPSKFDGSGPAAEAATTSPSTSSSQSDQVLKFCKGHRLNDGTQIKTGSCSATIQGAIPSIDKMISTLIISPKNGATLSAGKNITVEVKTKNMDLGLFLNPQVEYYTHPQTLNSKGLIQGHQHVVVQKINFDSQTPPDAQKFEFFKGLDENPSSNNILSTVIPNGLKKGEYRICTMTGSASHQPAIMPVAQRGSQDDCIRFTVK